MQQIRSNSFSPSRTILLSMVLAIVIGTAVLSLPEMCTRFVPLIDRLFIATSSICVTGLLTVPLNSFTQSGHMVIMLLIQIGGLGLITLTLFVVSLFMNLRLATQVMAGEMLDLETWSGTRQLLIFITLLTLSCEFFGACILFQSLKHHYSFFDACFYSLFQSISAFCNAGIDIVGGGLHNYSDDYIMLCAMSSLMLLGSVGFITLRELFVRWNPFYKTDKRVYSLQTRIILFYISLLTLFYTFVFWLLERNNTFEYMSFPQQIINSFFMAVSSRSAGFITVHANDMQQASLLSLMINSFIGSAPGSTGSGIKITTMAIFVATINSAVQGKSSIDIMGRRVMKDQIYKALAVVALSLLWIVLATFCLLITERSWHFIDILFETVNAFSTLGISIGITPYLSILGKSLIIITMFIGRVGSLTLMIALRKRGEKNEFSYPEERVMIS